MTTSTLQVNAELFNKALNEHVTDILKPNAMFDEVSVLLFDRPGLQVRLVVSVDEADFQSPGTITALPIIEDPDNSVIAPSK